MDVEEFLNDWCELIKKDDEKRRKLGVLYSDYIKFMGYNTSDTLEKQAENGEYSITLTLNYWSEDKIQKSKKYVNNYGKITETT